MEWRNTPGSLRAFHTTILLSIDDEARNRRFHDHSTAKTCSSRYYKVLEHMLLVGFPMTEGNLNLNITVYCFLLRHFTVIPYSKMRNLH